MREVQIPKRNGTFRTVVVPSKSLKRKLKALLPQLTAVGMTLDVYNVSHGFVPGRSPITCALAHRGYRYSLCMDLEDCFGHVTYAQVKKAMGVQGLPPYQYDCFYNKLPGIGLDYGVAAQGLPTSPAMCNIALAPMDAVIVRWFGPPAGVYTRYADDLTISSNDRTVIENAWSRLPGIVAKYGQAIAAHKTKIQDAAAGRRIIVGVAVGGDIQPTRAAKRKLRAAKHQRKHNHARGLAEWCKLREPNIGRAIQRYLGGGNDSWRHLCAVAIAQREVHLQSQGIELKENSNGS